MAQSQPTQRSKKWRQIASNTLATMGNALVMVAFVVHFRIYNRGTYHPIRRILECSTESELRHELRQWAKYKEHEAGYVQVAGAVMFASVTSCLSWNSLDKSHWSGPALWYGTIILSLSSIFTGAQQSLVLPEIDTIEKLSTGDLEEMKNSFTYRGRGSVHPSGFVLFAWQLPIMLLGYAVVSFVGGLCSVVISPLARSPGWNDEAKIVVTFLTIGVFSLICWALPSAFVHRIRSSKEGWKFEQH